jgi:hypothetical protein
MRAASAHCCRRQQAASSRAPARVEQRNSEGPLAATLRIRLLDVAELPHQLLARHRLVVSGRVLLRRQAAVLDQDVGVRCTHAKVVTTLRCA